MRSLRRRALLALTAVSGAALPFVQATPAQAWSCPTQPGAPLRQISNAWGDDSVVINMYCDNLARIYVSGTAYTGDLPQGHCFEVFHNVDLIHHRAPDLISVCSAWTAKSFTFDLYEQSGGRVEAWDIDWNNLYRKQTALCVTAQWDMRRQDWWTCSKGTWGGNEPMSGVHNHYDRDTYNTMWNGSATMNLRAVVGDMSCSPHNPAYCALFHREGGDRIASAGVTFSDWIRPMGGGRHIMIFQGDGNLVVYRIEGNGAFTPTWSSGTAGYAAGAKLRLQADGNLVIWRQETNDCLWHSGTYGTGAVGWGNSHQGALFGAFHANGWFKHLGYGGRC